MKWRPIETAPKDGSRILAKSETQQWMADHPDDVPCPRSFQAARAWRRKRGIGTGLWEKYQAAMRETRAARRAGLVQQVVDIVHAQLEEGR